MIVVRICRQYLVQWLVFKFFMLKHVWHTCGLRNLTIHVLWWLLESLSFLLVTMPWNVIDVRGILRFWFGHVSSVPKISQMSVGSKERHQHCRLLISFWLFPWPLPNAMQFIALAAWILCTWLHADTLDPTVPEPLPGWFFLLPLPLQDWCLFVCFSFISWIQNSRWRVFMAGTDFNFVVVSSSLSLALSVFQVTYFFGSAISFTWNLAFIFEWYSSNRKKYWRKMFKLEN